MKLLYLLASFLVGFVLQTTLHPLAYAQSPTAPNSPKVTLTYPITIPAVGTCGSWAECRKLCEDPINKQSCYTWAVAAKIIKPKDDQIIKQAMQDLSCTSKETCAAYCANPEHKEQCLSVGQKYNLLPNYQKRAQDFVQKIVTGDLSPAEQQAISEKFNTLKIEINKLAKDSNTDSSSLPGNLSTICAKKEYAASCQKIADALGEESSTPPGPGGCRTDASCRRYCDNPDNFAECKSFGLNGPQGCTSELSCYQVCQSGGCTNIVKPQLLSLDITKPEALQIISSLSKSCSDQLLKLSSDSVLETVAKLKNSGVCELYDVKDTTNDPSVKSCASYLDEHSDTAFNKDEFSQYCSSLAVIHNKIEKKTNQVTSTEQSNLQQLSTTCSVLEKLGTTYTPYSIEAANCKKSEEIIKKAREECQLGKTGSVVQTEEDARRYCLSAPADNTEYQKACQQNEATCQTGGYDWYCKQNPGKCVPLVEGQSIQKLTERFTQGVNVTTAINVINTFNGKTQTQPSSSGSPGSSKTVPNTRVFTELRILKSGVSTTGRTWDIPITANQKIEQAKQVTAWSTIPFIVPQPVEQNPLITPVPGQILPTIPYRPPIVATPYIQPDTSSGKTNTLNISPTLFPISEPTATPFKTTESNSTGTSGTSNSFITPTTYSSPTRTPSNTPKIETQISPSQIYNSPTPVTTTSNSGSGSTNSGPGSITNIIPTPTHPDVQGISDSEPWWRQIWDMFF